MEKLPVATHLSDASLKEVLESVREELKPLYAKHEYLHEMLRELYGSKNLESETLKYLEKKLDELNLRMNTLQQVRDYLANLEQGAPFNVNRRVGRLMTRFGLTAEQAELLLNVHKARRGAMGIEDQNNYSLACIRNVEWVEEENCLHVHFENNWWHYSVDGSWY